MKKTILFSSIVVEMLASSTNIHLVKADQVDSNDTSTLNVSAEKQNSNTNSNSSTKAPDDAPIFAKNPKIGPGYYKVPSKDDMLFESTLYASAAQQQEFLAKIKEGAIDGWKEYKILPSITAAQAILESGWGQNISGKNNFLGIKGNASNGTLCWTTEDGPNGTYQIQAYFRNFASYSDCLEYHNSLLGTNSLYSPIVGQKDYKVVANYLQGTYATSTIYASQLEGIIQANNLTEWDQEAFNETEFPHTAIDTSIITIKYVPNYGVLAYDSNGNSIGDSNKTFLDGTKWKTAGTKVINGEEMFEVATDEYIPLKYTTVGADGTVTINYTNGYGVLGYHADGSSISGSNSILKTGTSWKTSGAAVINGQIMYKIATDEYVPKEFTQFGNGK